MEQFRTNNGILHVEKRSRFKREFRISDDKHSIEVSFPVNPEGLIETKQGDFRIESAGKLGRKWILRDDKKKITAEAQRKGIRSAIDIEIGNEELQLSRKHLLSNEFELTSEDTVIAVVGKPKLISGDSEIHVFHADFDLLIYGFVFWICEHVREHTTDAWS